jgi:hypothetical protein
MNCVRVSLVRHPLAYRAQSTAGLPPRPPPANGLRSSGDYLNFEMQNLLRSVLS